MGEEVGQGDRHQREQEAYFRELRQWLEENRQWNQQRNGYLQLLQRCPQGNESGQVRQRRFQFSPPQPHSQPNLEPELHPQAEAQPPQGRVFKQYKIPSLWKRFVAEGVDFFLLLTLKLIMVVATFELGTILRMEYFLLPETVDQQKIALHLTVLELFQAFIALFCETLFLSSSLSATPGKHYMGLQVLYVESIMTNPEFAEGTIACYPATPLSIGRAFMRSTAKHVLCAFMFPVFYSLLTIGFNRTRYDMFAGTIVVEYEENPNVIVI